MADTHVRTAVRIEHLALRTVLIAMGLGASFTGYALLTTPLWVPIAIAIWLSAVPMLGLGVFGRLPNDRL